MALGENFKVKSWQRICRRQFLLDKLFNRNYKLFASTLRTTWIGGSINEVNEFFNYNYTLCVHVVNSSCGWKWAWAWTTMTWVVLRERPLGDLSGWANVTFLEVPMTSSVKYHWCLLCSPQSISAMLYTHLWSTWQMHVNQKKHSPHFVMLAFRTTVASWKCIRTSRSCVNPSHCESITEPDFCPLIYVYFT